MREEEERSHGHRAGEVIIILSLFKFGFPFRLL